MSSNCVNKKCGSTVLKLKDKVLQLGNFPDHWKKAFIIAIYKFWDKRNVKHFKPIS